MELNFDYLKPPAAGVETIVHERKNVSYQSHLYKEKGKKQISKKDMGWRGI